MMNYQLEVFYDGDCPLCRKEIALLQRRDHDGAVLFTDIAAAEFSEARAGKSYEALMASIHGKTPEGTWLEGVDLFAELYRLCRIPCLAALMRNPMLQPFLRGSYRLFARYRLSLTGRPSCTANCRVEQSG